MSRSLSGICVRIPAQKCSEASVSRHRTLLGSGWANVADFNSAVLTSANAFACFVPQRSSFNWILPTARLVRFPAILYTLSKACCRGAISRLNSGTAARIQFEAQTNCCKSAPVLGCLRETRDSKRLGSKRTPSGEMILPHHLTDVRNNRHLFALSLMLCLRNRGNNCCKVANSSCTCLQWMRRSSIHCRSLSRTGLHICCREL